MSRYGRSSRYSKYSWNGSFNSSWKEYVKLPLFQFLKTVITLLSLASIAMLIALMAKTRVFGSGFENAIAKENFKAISFQTATNNLFIAFIVIAATNAFLISFSNAAKRVYGAHLLNLDRVDGVRALKNSGTSLKYLGTERNNAAYAAYYSSHKVMEIIFIVFESVFRILEIVLCILVVIAFSETLFLALYVPKTDLILPENASILTLSEWFVPLIFGAVIVVLRFVFYIVKTSMYKHWVRKNGLKSSIK